MGSAESICHVYVDEEADLRMAERICIDAKTDCPVACNAVDTILFHKALLENGGISQIAKALKHKGESLSISRS